VVGAVRNLRSEYGVDPGRKVDLLLVDPPAALRRALEAETDGLRRLARLASVEVAPSAPEGEPGAHVVLRGGGEVFLPLRDLVDLERERERLVTELERLDGLLAATRARLGSAGFLEGAPPEVVERERDKATAFEERRARLLEKRSVLGVEGG
jgi:valyl-tRNA synthetase